MLNYYINRNFRNMQKLITIPLNDNNYKDTMIQEHLLEYLESNWHIIQMIPVGAGTGNSQTGGYVAGWLAIILEKA